MKKTIELIDVNKIYSNRRLFSKNTDAHILKDVSLVINEGETLGLVGESGSGKTTTTKMILRQEKPTSGQILYYGKDINDFSKEENEEYRHSVQMVFQDPYSSLNPEMKIKDIITEPLLISKKYSKEEINNRARKIMSRVGLAEDYLERYPKEFSGGQRQRIAIARALIESPKLLILDEPVSALDVSIRGQIMNLLKSLQHSGTISYLFISHDVASVGFLSDKIAVMYFGYIVEYAETATILEKYRHPYTEMLLESNGTVNLPEGDMDMLETPSHINPPKGCPFAARCAYATDECRETIPSLEEIEKGHFVACLHAGDNDFNNNNFKLKHAMVPEYYL